MRACAREYRGQYAVACIWLDAIRGARYMRSLWRGIPLQCDGKTAEAAARRGDQSERTGIIRKEYGMTTIHVKGLDKLRFMCAEYKPTVELYGRFVGKYNVIEHFTTMPDENGHEQKVS